MTPRATTDQDKGWEIAQRWREHPGRFREAIRDQGQVVFKVSIPLVFLAGLAFEGFFGFRNQRTAEVTLNIVTLVFLLGWVLQTVLRKTLNWLDPLLMLGCVLLVAGAGASLMQAFDSHWVELFLKTVGSILILFALDRLEQRRVIAAVRNSEEYLESIFESVPDPLFILGQGRRIVASNRLAIQTFGVDVLGKTSCEAVLRHTDCRSCCVTEAFERRKPRFEIVRDKNGARRFEVTTFPLFGRDGFSGRLIQQVRDVSSQSQSEDAVSIFQDAVNSVRDGVLILDLNAVLVRQNRAAEGFLGTDPVDAEPRVAKELLPFQSQRDQRDFLEALTVPKMWERECILEYSDTDRTVILSLAPIRANDGRLLGTVVLIRDITEVKSLQHQLMQNEKMSALGGLVSGVAHELNNPLTAVYGFAQILLEASLDAKSHQQVESICTYAERCRRIIEGLLRFARSHRAERERGNLNEVVRQALELVTGQVRLANIELEVNLDDSLPDSMMDAIQLQQVLINLVTNAQHAIESKSDVRGHIAIRTHRSDEQSMAMEVVDNGQGMSEEVRNKVFEPFFTTKEVGRGTGLGLSLSYGTIKDHGGTIDIVSKEGVGTKFEIRLPIVAPPKTTTAAVRDEGQPASDRRLSILVVDDEPAVLEILRHFLESDEHRVVTCDNARNALGQALQQPFDVVFTDWRMPEMNGEVFYGRLLQDHPQLRGKVVFITGDTFDTNIVEIASRDGSALINKPFTLETIRGIIQRLMNQGDLAAAES